MGLSENSCEICAGELYPIDVTALYTRGSPLYVCSGCGLVQVPERRSPEEIYEAWKNAKPGDDVYNAAKAAVAARHAYVKAFVGNFGDRQIDIGGGTGAFAETLPNCLSWHLMAEDVPFLEEFDTATLLWTLENCGSAVSVVNAARQVLKPGGKLVVATGSRILVPYKKPLHHYIGPGPQDLHPWRFSVNTLSRLLTSRGFVVERVNDYIGCDYLVVIARLGAAPVDNPPKDNYRKVHEYFSDWHTYSQNHFPPGGTK